MSAERRGPAICNVSNIGEGKDEMTKASIDLQDLRRRIYGKAKAEPSWRFWGLYVHVCKMETLRAAYEMAKETQGVEALLEQLRDELIGRTYQPLPARRQEIPKDGGKVRDLAIPAIRDRVVQGALKLILEPVFEADFQPGSFGYRPKRTAHEAIKRVAEAIVQRKTRVIDVDLRAYLDRVSYCTQIHEAWLKRSGREQLSLRRRPFLRPRLTWMTSMSPRLTRCHTVCRETPSRRMVWYMVRYPSGASSATRLRKSSVRRMRKGAPGVSCSPAMMPSLSQR